MDPNGQSGAYIREWLESVGLIQTDLVKQLGWSKAKANAVWHGEQRYNEDMLNEVALLVSARPYELLMDPKEAHRRRKVEADLREIAKRAAEADQAPETEEPGHRRAANDRQ